jgi:hypothetical protein
MHATKKKRTSWKELELQFSKKNQVEFFFPHNKLVLQYYVMGLLIQ